MSSDWQSRSLVSYCSFAAALTTRHLINGHYFVKMNIRASPG